MGTRPWLLPLVVALAAAYGLYHAISLAWLCDDAFISFRYAQNLVDGHGLVFNVGERVEGYTNFLWTLLLAGASWGGLDMETTAQVLGVVCYVATIALLVWRGAPWAALVLALHHHASSMAAFGLETSLFALLLTGACLALMKPSHLWAGILLTLATLTRPDGALPYLVACVLVLVQKRGGFWALILPGILVGVPYAAFKLTYYGYLLPNTFYAKSAAEPYPGRGLWYVGLYFAYYPLLLAGLVVPLVCLWRRRSTTKATWITAFAVPYLLYVIWVGGDFMFARFCLPVTPVLCLGLGLAVAALRGTRAWVAGTVVVAVALLPHLLLKDAKWVGPDRLQIAEERNCYHPLAPELHEHLGRYLHDRLEGQELVLAVGGGAAMLAYYCDWATVIELFGLTDKTIARRRVERRGRVGHEKFLPFTDPYLRERGVHFVCVPFFADFVEVSDRVPEDLRHLTFLVYNDGYKGGKEPYEVKLTILTYDRRIMDPLVGAKDVRFQPFDQFLDHYIQDMGQKSKEDVRRDYADFRKFYFDGNQDPVRRKAFEDFLR